MVGCFQEVIDAPKRPAGEHTRHPFFGTAAIKQRLVSLGSGNLIDPVDTGQPILWTDRPAKQPQSCDSTVRENIHSGMRRRADRLLSSARKKMAMIRLQFCSRQKLLPDIDIFTKFTDLPTV